MLTEKEFLEKCLEEYNNKSTKIMKSHEQIKLIFQEIENRLKGMVKKDGKQAYTKKIENK